MLISAVYSASKILATFSLSMFTCSLMCVISYGVVGMDMSRFPTFLLIINIACVGGNALGSCVSAVSANEDMATGIGAPFVFITLLFSGYFVYVYLLCASLTDPTNLYL